MRAVKLLLLSLLILPSGCGGDAAPSFDGVWDGSYSTLTNSCPFTVAQDINPLFPMTVSVDGNDVFTVVAVNGDTAVGGQGQGESISFLAQSSEFGEYGSIAPYTCQSIVSEVGLLSIGEDKAKATLTIKFTDCSSSASDTSLTTCGATYFGDATRTSK
jgi:hypothetical protein